MLHREHHIATCSVHRRQPLSLLLSLLIMLISTPAVQEGDGSPLYVSVVSPASSFRQFAADLITGWNNEINPRESVELGVVLPNDACTIDLSVTNVRGRTALVNLALGSCDFVQRAATLQSAGALAVFFWHPERDLVLPALSLESSVRNFISIPLFGVTRSDALTIDGVLAIRQMRISLPVIEPQTCVRAHLPTLTAASFLVSSARGPHVLVTGSFPGTAANCWFYTLNDKNSTCLQASSSDANCRAPSSPAIFFNATTILCPLPAQVSLASAVAQYRVTVEVLFTSASLVSARCFSHQHLPILMWSREAFVTLSSAPFVNTTNLPTDLLATPCACSPDGRSGRVDNTGTKGCAALLQNSTQLWCFVQDPDRCALATPSSSFSGASARPCYTTFPGQDSSLCGGACRGSACSPEGICTCFDGWIGRNCTVALCVNGCIPGQGTCVSPNVCSCDAGWSGSSCQTPVCPDNCSNGNGICIAPGKCVCKTGFGGISCSTAISAPNDDSSNSGTGKTTTIIVAGVLSTLLVIALLYFIFGREGSTTVILQSAPDGVDLGPLVSRVVTTKRTFLWCTRTVEREEDFFESNPHNLRERRAGLLPSYNETIRAIPPQFENDANTETTESHLQNPISTGAALFRDQRRFATTRLLELPEDEGAQDSLFETSSVRSLPPAYSPSDPLRGGQATTPRRVPLSSENGANPNPATTRNEEQVVPSSPAGQVSQLSSVPDSPLPPLQLRLPLGPPPPLRPLSASSNGSQSASFEPPSGPFSFFRQGRPRPTLRSNVSSSSIVPLLEQSPTPMQPSPTDGRVSEGPAFLRRTPTEIRFPSSRPPSGATAWSPPPPPGSSAPFSLQALPTATGVSESMASENTRSASLQRRAGSNPLAGPPPPTSLLRFQRRPSLSSSETLFPMQHATPSEDDSELSVRRVVQQVPLEPLSTQGLQPGRDAAVAGAAAARQFAEEDDFDVIRPPPRPRVFVEDHSDEQEREIECSVGARALTRSQLRDSGVEVLTASSEEAPSRQRRRKRLRLKQHAPSSPSAPLSPLKHGLQSPKHLQPLELRQVKANNSSEDKSSSSANHRSGTHHHRIPSSSDSEPEQHGHITATTDNIAMFQETPA